MYVSVHYTFNLDNYGWAEQYYIQQQDGSTLEAIVNGPCVALLAKRMQLCCKGVEAGPFRASVVQLTPVPAGSATGRVSNTGLVRPGVVDPASVPPPQVAGGLPNSAVHGLAYVAGQGRNKKFSMRGIWGSLNMSGGAITQDATYASYLTKLQEFTAVLKVAGAGWFGSSKALRVVNISDIAAVPGGAGRQLITVANNFFDAATEIGKHVTIRISSAKKNPNINGTVTVVPLSATTAETVGPMVMDAYAGGAKLTITPLQWFVIDSLAPIRISHHDTKSPTVGSRGRRKATSRG